MLKAISLFSGAGGCSLGFKQTGKYDIIAAYDNNKKAVLTYNLNFGEKASILDLSSCNFASIRKELSLQKGELDIILGGPPCQGFSSAGTRSINDPRNKLISKYVEALKEFHPKWFFMENVEGILTAANGEYIVEALKSFSQLGYSVAMEKVYAQEYGIPQRRKRVIIIGNRIGAPLSFPEPTFKMTGKIFRNSSVTIKHVIGDLESYEIPAISHKIKIEDGINLERISYLKPGQTMKDLPEFLQHDSFKKRANRRVSDGMLSEKRGGAPSGLKRLIYDEPSLTITGSSNREFVHPVKDRALTIRECARIQTFPDDFLFQGNSAEQIKQIGNAVPPKLANIFAEHIFKLNNLSLGKNKHIKGLISFKLTKATAFSPALANTYRKLITLPHPKEHLP